MLRQHAPCRRQRARRIATADQQGRGPDRSRLASRKRLAVLADLSDQRKRIIPQLLFGGGRQPPPGAVAIDCVEEKPERAVDVAVWIICAAAGIRAATGAGGEAASAGQSVASR